MNDKNRMFSGVIAMFHIFIDEIKNIFKDPGIVLLVMFATFIYPLIYNAIYHQETLTDVPIGVIDNSHSMTSKEFIRHLDATRDIKVYAHYADLAEAKKALYSREIHGIVYIPKELEKETATGKQGHISIYCDMSSFLYYRSLMMAANYVLLDLNKKIQVERINMKGISGEDAKIISEPMSYESVIYFNPYMGFASFLLPALLILVLHQTLVYGIGSAAGVAREENPHHALVSGNVHHGKLFRVILGKAMAFFFLYIFWSAYALILIPSWFNLVHIGAVTTLIVFIIPFLLATIFFAMTLSVFNPSREIEMMLLIFFSVILIFLSGIAWPQSNINGFWKAFSYLFPSTFGIQAFVKINNTGASIDQIRPELIGLWIQTGVYFLFSGLLYFREIRKQKMINAIE